MVDNSDLDSLLASFIKEYSQDQNTKSKLNRLRDKYVSAPPNTINRVNAWKNSNPSMDNFPDEFKNITDDFFFLERDFIYKGSVYFMLNRAGFLDSTFRDLAEIKRLFSESAKKFSDLINELLKDKHLEINLVLRLCFIYLRIIAGISRLSVSQQMPRFSRSRIRTSPGAVFYVETNLASNLDPHRAYSLFRGLIQSVADSSNQKTFFYIINEFSISKNLIDLCWIYVDICLGEKIFEENFLLQKGLPGLLLTKNPQLYQQMQFGLSNGLSDSHKKFLKKLKIGLSNVMAESASLFDLGRGTDQLSTKLTILYWLNLIGFPERTFKQSEKKRKENIDYFSLSEDALILNQEHYEVKVKAYSEKSPLDTFKIPELHLLSKQKKEGREDYELKGLLDEETIPEIIELSHSLFPFETYDDLSFLKITDKAMYPTFDVGDLLIIKNVDQFKGYDKNYVIEASDSLEVRRIIKTGNLEENRGVLSPANQEFKEAEISISDLHIRGLVVGVFKSLEEPIN